MSGWFALLGSGEFAEWTHEVDRWLLDRATGDGRVVVVPTASSPEGDAVFDDWASRGLAHYAAAGIPVEVLPVRDRVDADDAAMVAQLGNASIIFFSGGNPAYLARTLADTALWLAVKRGLDRGMAYAGCSAGIASLGQMAPDSTVSHLDESLWQPGLALFPNAWFGPHWNALDRYAPGLTERFAASVPEGQLLVGVDEDTAMVGDGKSWRVLGRSGVHVRESAAWSTHASGSTFTATLT